MKAVLENYLEFARLFEGDLHQEIEDDIRTYIETLQGKSGLQDVETYFADIYAILSECDINSEPRYTLSFREHYIDDLDKKYRVASHKTDDESSLLYRYNKFIKKLETAEILIDIMIAEAECSYLLDNFKEVYIFE